MAADAAYRDKVKELKNRLFSELEKTGDPRVTGEDVDFDAFEYLGGAPKFPEANKK